jgi:hypothetical protein
MCFVAVSGFTDVLVTTFVTEKYAKAVLSMSHRKRKISAKSDAVGIWGRMAAFGQEQTITRVEYDGCNRCA